MSRRDWLSKSGYLFNFLLILILTGGIYVFTTIKIMQKDIEKTYLQSHIQYISNVTANIAKIITKYTNKNIVETLRNDPQLRKRLNETLELFISKRHKYIFVVRKSEKGDRFQILLDGSKEKSEFLEDFQPYNLEKWKEVYKTKKPVYFQHKDINELWLTYLRPIIINKKVEAVIAVDFSFTEYNNIEKYMQDLSQIIKIFTIFSILLMLLIMVLDYFDKKKLLLLEKQSEEIKEFNKTLQKRIEEEVAKNREKDQQILAQSRLAQMGEMLGMIAHQWRQPINAISVTAITIDMKAQLGQLDDESAIELADKISEFTQHLSKTIDDFRDFFKPIKEKSDITYAELIQSTLDIVQQSLANKNIKIEVEIDSDVTFHTYVNELKQVLLNLIKNAEDVLIEREVENPTVKIVAKGTTLSVSDNGGGVPEEILPKIFDPYFSTKKLNGTGLGLYMSKTIVEEHCGGKLTVHNDEEGAVFTIELLIEGPEEKTS